MLTDFNSTNGVHVDGQPVEGAVPLQPGARVAIGPFSLTYQRGTASDLAEAEAAERELTMAVAYIQALLPAPLRKGRCGRNGTSSRRPPRRRRVRLSLA